MEDRPNCGNRLDCGGCHAPCEASMPEARTYDRRAHERKKTSAHFLLSIGLDRGGLKGYATVRQISQGGLVMETDLLQDHLTRILKQSRSCIIIMGAESWNRHFSIHLELRRITVNNGMACSIIGHSSSEFLDKWIEERCQ